MVLKTVTIEDDLVDSFFQAPLGDDLAQLRRRLFVLSHLRWELFLRAVGGYQSMGILVIDDLSIQVSETSIDTKTRSPRGTLGLLPDTVFDASPRILSRFDSHCNLPDC